MFSFFHRKKTIVLDCFTDNSYAYTAAPIIRASKAFPEWWKTLPTPENGMKKLEDFDGGKIYHNMKRCYGFIELFKRSIIIESWTDYNFAVTEKDYRFNYAGGTAPEEHILETQANGAFSEFHHTKLSTPWVIREKTGVQFAFVGAEWDFQEYLFKIPPGVLEFKMNNSINVNMLLPKATYNFHIPTGKSLAHLIPLVEDAKIEIKNHLVTTQELNTLRGKPFAFKGIYDYAKLLKRNEERQKSKCPFHFS
jgi:hypothetical protein